MGVGDHARAGVDADDGGGVVEVVGVEDQHHPFPAGQPDVRERGEHLPPGLDVVEFHASVVTRAQAVHVDGARSVLDHRDASLVTGAAPAEGPG